MWRLTRCINVHSWRRSVCMGLEREWPDWPAIERPQRRETERTRNDRWLKLKTHFILSISLTLPGYTLLFLIYTCFCIEKDKLKGGGKEDEGTSDVFISIQAFPALVDVSEAAEINKVSCGSRHTAAITSKILQHPCPVVYIFLFLWCWNYLNVLLSLGTGDLYTWGWGKTFYFLGYD